MSAGIYCITNKINMKRYIGQSRNITKRWRDHKYNLNHSNHENEYLQRAWGKYGEENFEFTVLEECAPEELNDLEVYYIKKYDTFENREKGYNLQSGGGHVNHSLETKAKQSEAKLGEKNPMYGKTHSQKSRKKMSEAQSEYTIWDPAKCVYDKINMFRKNRDGSTPRRCFRVKYNGKTLPIGSNLDFLSAEIISDLIKEYTME